MLKLHVIASGSGGNASIIENVSTGKGVLVDCGITKKALLAGCESSEFNPANIEGLFITHEHCDHIKGVGVALRGLDKLGCCPQIHVAQSVFTASAGLQKDLKDRDVRWMSGLHDVSVAGIRVIPFPTSHDAAGSFGFRFECQGDAIGFMTDTGTVLPDAHELLQHARILALESNHDPLMLKEGPYPYPVKKRIASDLGHLSNGQSAAELAQLLHNDLECVVAMHVSQHNNDYQLAQDNLRALLQQFDHPANVYCGFQQLARSYE